VEPGSCSDSNRWGPFGTNRFVNGAIVSVGKQRFLEAKCWPSQVEQSGGYHVPHGQIRLFRGANGFSFAVVICSEILDQHVDGWRRLAEGRPDVVVWIQHNDAPRSSQLAENVERFFGSAGQHRTLIVAANVRPNGIRGRYGASGLIAVDSVYAETKNAVRRPHIAHESFARRVVRSTIIAYHVPLVNIRTALPAHLPIAGDLRQSRRQFIFDVNLYDQPGSSRNDRQYVDQLVEACESAGSTVPIQVDARACRQKTRDKLLKPSFDLLDFIDKALVQRTSARRHRNHEPHPVTAAWCDCWDHRHDFDSLFAPRTAELLHELMLAIGELERRGITVTLLDDEKLPNVELLFPNGARHKFVLAAHAGDSLTFHRDYFGEPPLPYIGQLNLIVLRSTFKVRSLDAAAVGASDAARVATAKPDGTPITGTQLFGDDFWTQIDRLQQRVEGAQ
jgi:hypothetical protein